MTAKQDLMTLIGRIHKDKPAIDKAWYAAGMDVHAVACMLVKQSGWTISWQDAWETAMDTVYGELTGELK